MKNLKKIQEYVKEKAKFLKIFQKGEKQQSLKNNAPEWLDFNSDSGYEEE